MSFRFCPVRSQDPQQNDSSSDESDYESKSHSGFATTKVRFMSMSHSPTSSSSIAASSAQVTSPIPIPTTSSKASSPILSNQNQNHARDMHSDVVGATSSRIERRHSAAKAWSESDSEFEDDIVLVRAPVRTGNSPQDQNRWPSHFRPRAHRTSYYTSYPIKIKCGGSIIGSSSPGSGSGSGSGSSSRSCSLAGADSARSRVESDSPTFPLPSSRARPETSSFITTSSAHDHVTTKPPTSIDPTSPLHASSSSTWLPDDRYIALDSCSNPRPLSFSTVVMNKPSSTQAAQASSSSSSTAAPRPRSNKKIIETTNNTSSTSSTNQPTKTPRYQSRHCHQDKKTPVHQPRMYCSNQECSFNYCDKCIRKHYSHIPFINNTTFECPACQGICSCARCVKSRDRNKKVVSAPRRSYGLAAHGPSTTSSSASSTSSSSSSSLSSTTATATKKLSKQRLKAAAIVEAAALEVDGQDLGSATRPALPSSEVGASRIVSVPSATSSALAAVKRIIAKNPTVDPVDSTATDDASTSVKRRGRKSSKSGRPESSSQPTTSDALGIDPKTELRKRKTKRTWAERLKLLSMHAAEDVDQMRAQSLDFDPTSIMVQSDNHDGEEDDFDDSSVFDYDFEHPQHHQLHYAQAANDHQLEMPQLVLGTGEVVDPNLPMIVNHEVSVFEDYETPIFEHESAMLSSSSLLDDPTTSLLTDDSALDVDLQWSSEGPKTKRRRLSTTSGSIDSSSSSISSVSSSSSVMNEDSSPSSPATSFEDVTTPPHFSTAFCGEDEMIIEPSNAQQEDLSSLLINDDAFLEPNEKESLIGFSSIRIDDLMPRDDEAWSLSAAGHDTFIGRPNASASSPPSSSSSSKNNNGNKFLVEPPTPTIVSPSNPSTSSQVGWFDEFEHELSTMSNPPLESIWQEWQFS